MIFLKMGRPYAIPKTCRGKGRMQQDYGGSGLRVLSPVIQAALAFGLNDEGLPGSPKYVVNLTP